MGIYIPDMEMPKDGDFELWIAIKKDGSFTYNIRGKWKNGKQKVIPVSDHGRLVDATEMFEYFVIEGQRSRRYKLGEKWELNGEEIRKVIAELPTIIPASREEEDS